MLTNPLVPAAIAIVFASITFKVHGHGHLISPRSRNFYAKEAGAWSGGDEKTPEVETCSHCEFAYHILFGYWDSGNNVLCY